MHHLTAQCIYLVWSSIPELHRQPEIIDHQHVPPEVIRATTMQVPRRLEVLPTMWSGWLEPRRHSCVPLYWSHPGTWVSLISEISRLDSGHSCSPTLCRSSPKGHEPSSLRWNCCTCLCWWSIVCKSLSSNALPPRSVHLSCLVFHLRTAPTVEYECIMAIFTLPLWESRFRPIL